MMYVPGACLKITGIECADARCRKCECVPSSIYMPAS